MEEGLQKSSVGRARRKEGGQPDNGCKWDRRGGEGFVSVLSAPKYEIVAKLLKKSYNLVQIRCAFDLKGTFGLVTLSRDQLPA